MLVTMRVQGIMNDGPGYEARLAALEKALELAASYHMVGVMVALEDESDPTEESDNDR